MTPAVSPDLIAMMAAAEIEGQANAFDDWTMIYFRHWPRGFHRSAWVVAGYIGWNPLDFLDKPTPAARAVNVLLTKLCVTFTVVMTRHIPDPRDPVEPLKAVLPGMVARRAGCIVNVSSVVGRVAVSPQAPYAASKHALEALSECLAHEVRAFNIRVAIIEPGPIATPMARKILVGQPTSAYPQGRRLAALFAAFMKQPTSPYVVGEQIRSIIENDSWQLRYPIGPHAPRFMNWRRKTSDEEWVSLFGGTDDEFALAVKSELGLDLAL
jgi:hypothetical protein